MYKTLHTLSWEIYPPELAELKSIEIEGVTYVPQALMNHPDLQCLADMVGLESDFLDGGEPCSWEHNEPMLDISKRYPNYLFTLHCQGENPEDMSRYYYLNGKCQHEVAEIKIDPFDPNKLK